MTSAECIAKALLTPNFKITRASWTTGYYVFCLRDRWLSQDDDPFEGEVKPSDVWLPYTEPDKKITWYRPTVVWVANESSPRESISNHYFKSKDYYIMTDACKVLEWEEIQAPETWGQVNEK